MATAEPLVGTQSITRAAAIMQAVAMSGAGGVRLRDVAERTKLNVATARRILQALNVEGFLSFDNISKLYTIGPTIYSYAVLGNPWYARRDTLLPALDEIAEKTGDTVLLSIKVGTEAVCMVRREGSFPIRVMTLDVGTRRPLGVGSGSVVILAFLPADERRQILKLYADVFPSFGLDRRAVETMIDEARRTGFAMNEGLVIEGVFGLAVPVIVDRKPIASISVAAIASRMGPERRGEVLHIMQEALAKVAPRLSR
jgi:DNA-binding IclR family transcriptional regulator